MEQSGWPHRQNQVFTPWFPGPDEINLGADTVNSSPLDVVPADWRPRVMTQAELQRDRAEMEAAWRRGEVVKVQTPFGPMFRDPREVPRGRSR